MQKKSRFLRKKFAKDCPKARKGLKKLRWGRKDSYKRAKDAGNGVFASAEGKVVAL